MKTKAYFLIGLAVLALTFEVWQLANPVAAPVTAPASLTPQAPSQPKATDNIKVAELHLFGRAMTSDEAALNASSLAVTIEGIMGTDVESSKGYSALIRLTSGGTKLVQVGEMIASGVVVQAIRSDGIIIDNHGRLERIMLKRPPGLFG